jgi:hypothetical protein
VLAALAGPQELTKTVLTDKILRLPDQASLQSPALAVAAALAQTVALVKQVALVAALAGQPVRLAALLQPTKDPQVEQVQAVLIDQVAVAGQPLLALLDQQVAMAAMVLHHQLLALQ